MSIQIIDGFQVNTALPIDNRIVASGSAARNAISYKYEGLRVFDTSDSIPYVWLNGAWVSENASGIVGSGTSTFFPLFTSSNVVSDSFLYQDAGVIKTGDDGGGSDLVEISPYYGTVTAQGGFVGPGTSITNLNGNNINNGSISVNGVNSKIIQGSTGQVLVSGSSNTTWTNQSQLSVGTASVSSNVSISPMVANANHFLAFFSAGLWQSATFGTSSNIRSSTGISYNPTTNVLNTGAISSSGNITTTGRFNTNNGSLPSTVNSRLIAASFSSNTTPNSTFLEIFNSRFSSGSDWLSSGYRMQSRVDDQYMGYIQFNGLNEAGISFGTGYVSNSTSINNNTERMRIDGTGRILAGTSSSISGNCILHLASNSTLSDGIVHRAFNNSNYIFEFKNTAGTNRGQIAGAGSSAISYATSSDKRLKDDIQDMPSMYDKVKNLRPSKFKWREDNSEDFGFIAQEVFNLLPGLRQISDDHCDVNSPDFDIENPVRKDGSQHYYALDYGKLTPYLTKALQETMDKLETLTNKIKSANTLEELKSSL